MTQMPPGHWPATVQQLADPMPGMLAHAFPCWTPAAAPRMHTAAANKSFFGMITDAPPISDFAENIAQKKSCVKQITWLITRSRKGVPHHCGRADRFGVGLLQGKALCCVFSRWCNGPSNCRSRNERRPRLLRLLWPEQLDKQCAHHNHDGAPPHRCVKVGQDGGWGMGPFRESAGKNQDAIYEK